MSGGAVIDNSHTEGIGTAASTTPTGCTFLVIVLWADEVPRSQVDDIFDQLNWAVRRWDQPLRVKYVGNSKQAECVVREWANVLFGCTYVGCALFDAIAPNSPKRPNSPLFSPRSRMSTGSISPVNSPRQLSRSSSPRQLSRSSSPRGHQIAQILLEAQTTLATHVLVFANDDTDIGYSSSLQEALQKSGLKYLFLRS